ncbi:hypothetical protein RvY_01290 [Ramazzottius varieornatus]|uniref:DUF4371 domain-containing protein n=1 Tax=Ramazzottius varieornatus TaxID=947166 RepID=A0A1D1UQI4_RAMVA|nr:hypothetical protein RvY_01290 [Ramazzottius varieornatus]
MNAVKRYGVDMGNSHMWRWAARKITTHISMKMRCMLVAWLTKTQLYFDVMIDESTDSDGSQNLIIYIRVEIDGDPVSFFWGLVKLRKTTSAADITDALLDDLIASNWLGLKRDHMVMKWVGFATGGASALTGPNRLAEQFPLIMSTHCVAHRLQLIVDDTVKKRAISIKFEDAVRDIYSYYSR